MIQAYLEDILERLSVSPVITSFQVLRHRTTNEEGHLRVKCKLLNDDIIEMNEYVEIKGEKIEVVTYSFHWQKDTAKLVKRWDNVAHHRKIESFPDHVHIETDRNVQESEPMNFEKVIKILEARIAPEEVE